MRPPRAVSALLASLLLSAPACTVWIDRAPQDVEGAYRSARSRIDRVEKRSHRIQVAHSVHVLAWQVAEDRLIRFSVPLHLVRSLARHLDDGEAIDFGHGVAPVKVGAEAVLDHGPGLVFEADSDEARVLVWLE